MAWWQNFHFGVNYPFKRGKVESKAADGDKNAKNRRVGAERGEDFIT